MKKIITLLTIAFAAAGSLMAQNNQRTVKGFVIDNNGNPIAGAEVMATGGGETAITDADGSFSMTVSPFLKTITATYTGMGSKKLKTKFDRDMIFRMSPKNDYWFLNAVGIVSTGEGFTGGGGGLMGGYLGKWGGYLKATIDNCLMQDDPKVPTITLGVIKSFSNKVYGYLGVGYSQTVFEQSYYYSYSYYSYFYDTYNYGSYWDWETHTENAVAVEVGCIFRTSRHFNFTVGYTLAANDYIRHTVNVGAGYVF